MGSTLSPVQEELIRKHTTAHSRIIVMLDEDEAGRAGREQIVQRLVSKAFVRVVHFEKEGQQPEDLSAEKLFGFVGRPLNTDAGMIGQDD
jgi:DNA primase